MKLFLFSVCVLMMLFALVNGSSHKRTVDEAPTITMEIFKKQIKDIMKMDASHFGAFGGDVSIKDLQKLIEDSTWYQENKDTL